MSENDIGVMNNLFRKLPEIIRLRDLNCNINSRKCIRCKYYEKKINGCMLNELKKNTIKNIMELSKNKI